MKRIWIPSSYDLSELDQDERKLTILKTDQGDWLAVKDENLLLVDRHGMSNIYDIMRQILALDYMLIDLAGFARYSTEKVLEARNVERRLKLNLAALKVDLEQHEVTKEPIAAR